MMQKDTTMTTITTIDYRCENCFLKTYERLFKKFDVKIVEQELFLSIFQKVINEKQYDSHPEIQRELNHPFCDIIL